MKVGGPWRQVMVAAVISTMYVIVMTAVIIAFAINIVKETVMSPSAWFLFLVVSEIAIAGLLHPYEVDCLLYSLIYYLAVPSMYVLLIIYSLCNLNNISWGTREVEIRKSHAVINLIHFTNFTNLHWSRYPRKCLRIYISFHNFV